MANEKKPGTQSLDGKPYAAGVDMDVVDAGIQRAMSEEHERQKAAPKLFAPEEGHYIADVPLEKLDDHLA